MPFSDPGSAEWSPADSVFLARACKGAHLAETFGLKILKSSAQKAALRPRAGKVAFRAS